MARVLCSVSRRHGATLPGFIPREWTTTRADGTGVRGVRFSRSTTILSRTTWLARVIYLTTGGGGAGTYEVDATKEGKPGGLDPYHCSKKGSPPGILSAAVSYWHHYCHVAIDGKKLTLKAYPHNSTTKPKDSFTISH